MKCAKCEWEYPEIILSSMIVDRKYTPPICGICALEISNENFPEQFRRSKFNGTEAESMRQSAIKWRESHPNDAPIGEK